VTEIEVLREQLASMIEARDETMRKIDELVEHKRMIYGHVGEIELFLRVAIEAEEPETETTF